MPISKITDQRLKAALILAYLRTYDPQRYKGISVIQPRKIVVSVGGGLGSTLKLPEQVIAEYGRDNVSFVMARLPNEDRDVWRLVESVEDLYRIKVQFIGENLTPFDIFHRERILGNSRIDPCSRILKRETLARYMAENHDPQNTIMAVGILYHEIDRMAAIRSNWIRNGWQVVAPLANDTSLTREYLMQYALERVGFVPRLYLMGMSHNNCGGACIKAGKAQWARLLWYLPEVYQWWEDNENLFRATVGEYTILTRNRNKTPLTLTDFRIELQARWATLLPGFDPFEGLEETPPCTFCESA